MKIPVTVRTHRTAIQDMAETPQIGGWALLLMATGPPSFVGLLGVLVDAVRRGMIGESWGFASTGFPFLGDGYFILMFAAMIPFNLLLAYRFDVAIRIFYLPAWAFGVLGVVLGVTVGA